MALAVPNIQYKIEQSFRGSTNDVYCVCDFGDFFSIIDFEIEGIKGTGIKGTSINGIIFQKITKITKIIVEINKGIETLLDKTKEILDYTKGNVDFTNETYLEYFVVKNGRVGGDQFQNSAITRYKKKNVDYNNVSDYGVILQKGECVFISSTNTAPLINPHYEWNINISHASNGLYYFDNKSKPLNQMNFLWDLIKGARQSEIVCHIIEYYWRKDLSDQECSTNVFVERMNKTEADIQPHFMNHDTIPAVKNIVDEMINNQKSRCPLRRQNSWNTRMKFVKPMPVKKTASGKIIQNLNRKINPLFTGYITPRISSRTSRISSRISPRKSSRISPSSSARIFVPKPGGGTIKSKKRRQTVKNRKKHNRKTVKRRKLPS